MRIFIIRSISFLCLVTAWYFDVWWIGVPLAFWHFFQYRAYECIVIAICIDVQFMTGLTLPWYTIGALSAFVLAELLKPLVRRTMTIQL
jgi:hypothetical protein